MWNVFFFFLGGGGGFKFNLELIWALKFDPVLILGFEIRAKIEFIIWNWFKDLL